MSTADPPSLFRNRYFRPAQNRGLKNTDCRLLKEKANRDVSVAVPIQLTFLGHERPALPVAAERLLTQFARGNTADLRNLIVVLPSSRAGRRLLEILVESARVGGLVFTPPIIETVGRLPEQLYVPRRPFASELTQRFTWTETLRCAAPEALAPLIPRQPLGKNSTRWLELADLLRKQHAELAADGLMFADVAKRGADVPGFAEQARWQAMAELQAEYLRRLDALMLWDVQTARLVAVEKRECKTDHDIVLIGAVDLNRTLRNMLDQIAGRVTAQVFAPESWRERFDVHGCLRPEVWSTIELPIQSDQIDLADGPGEQAEAVVRQCAAFDGRYRADEIVLGMPDESLIPDVQRRLAVRGVTTRWGPGESLSFSRPIRLLQAIAASVEHARFVEFAALARHPDLANWLGRKKSPGYWLEQLDDYQVTHLPFRLADEWLGPEKDCARAQQAWNAIHKLLHELSAPPRLLTNWSTAIWDLLVEVYGQRPLQRDDLADRTIVAACTAVRETLRDFSEIPPTVMPTLSAADALRLVVEEIKKETVSPPTAANAIEMVGWLELPLDDAPAAVVTNFNEGFVPESANSDLFLPNALRRQLGLLDNARRFARDAYAVAVLAASRQSLKLIVGRRNRDGDPLIPSRLLFATDAATAAERARNVFRPVENTSSSSYPAVSISGPGLEIPRPERQPNPLARLGVTSFRDYLTCPYRFYLRHVLKLEPATDALDELDGRTFGNLAHEVLRSFGVSPCRDSTDPVELREMLSCELDRVAAEWFGRHALPAVRVQVEQLRFRLNAFAEKQAEWAAQGWRIEHTEVPATRDETAEFLVDDVPLALSGRIDRIDVHRDTGERAILDYKTSDGGDPPKKVHQRRGEWIDLQLPLYRHLAASLRIPGSPRLGYVVLPRDTANTGFVLAEWTMKDLAQADEVARQVVRRIRQQEFWPPADPPPLFSEAFAAICHDGVRKG